MKFLILLAVAICAAACSTKVLNTQSTNVRDSIVLKTQVVYDTVKVAADSVGLAWINTVDTLVHHGRAELRVSSKNGRTSASCVCDSIKIAKKLAVHDTVHHYIKNTMSTKTEIKLVASAFDKFCRWFFIAICCGAAVLTALKVSKYL